MASDRTPIPLPECGMFIGSGVYPMSAGYLLSALYGHLSWAPQSFSPQEMIDKIIADKQGNLAQFWGYSRGYAPATHAEWLYALDEIGVRVPEPDFEKGTNLRAADCPELARHADRLGAGALRFARLAARKGIYTTFIYTDAHPQWSKQLKDLGKYYLGYDFGERFTFRLDEKALANLAPADVTLDLLADRFVQRVREHVDERKTAGWGPILATSSNFYIDYEVLGGVDIPLLEDFAFSHLNVASALSRGLCRQHGLTLWGSHLAHEHYSWIPYRNPRKFDLLTASMYLKYMAGAKIVINESGNWFVEASLCEDSPKHDLPPVPLRPEEVSWSGETPVRFLPYVAEARKHFHKLDYGSVVCRRYREVIREFYEYVQAHGTPAGQPEATVAVAKGNYDLCSQRFSPNRAIAGAYSLAEANPAWYEGAPERGWQIVAKAFYPLVPVLGENPNLFLSGTPYGPVDIVSFAGDRITAEFLHGQYKALLFAGWNTSSDRQLDILTEYVARGGTLFIAIPHLSTDTRRNYGSYTADDLVRGGDFSELCGVRVRGRGRRYYWATAPRGSDELGIRFPRRFGIMETCLGDIDVVDPAAQVLLVEDERAEPLLLRRRHEKGTVYFLNSWAYPGALDRDVGPGSTVNSPGLVGLIYRHIARTNRGRVYITDDGLDAGTNCQYVCVSHFPEAEKTYLYNIDFEHPRHIHLHRDGQPTPIDLAPGEFRLGSALKR